MLVSQVSVYPLLQPANYAKKHATGTDQEVTVLIITRHKITFYMRNTLNKSIDLWPHTITSMNDVVFT
jgi:hypothetical protein